MLQTTGFYTGVCVRALVHVHVCARVRVQVKRVRVCVHVHGEKSWLRRGSENP